jgi:polar amino acid transport system permease protein
MVSVSNDRAALPAEAQKQMTEMSEDVTDISHLVHVRRRYWGRYVASAAIIALIGYVVLAFAHGQIEWSYVARFLTARSILNGLVNTIVMTVLAMVLGVVLGVITAIMRLSPNPVLQAVAQGYVWLFRGTPVILQLLLWFNLALVFPSMGIPGLFEFRTVDVMTPFLAALLGLGINQGAYTSEVVRAGLLSVDTGQYEAAKSIGMPRLQALRRIILPQAMRMIVPPIGNELVGMVKLTSLASVIQYAEMLHNAENIYYANARVIELLMVAGVWYLVVVTVLSFAQSRVERHYARGAGRASGRQ